MQRAPVPVAESYPSQRFDGEAYAQGRMQIFGRFWRDAENTWDAARFRLAEVDQETLNGRQAYQAYVYLRTCLDAPRSPADATEYLDRVERAAEHNRRLQNPDQLERILERVDAALLRCEGLEGDLEDDAMTWLLRAAERGYPLAQIAYHRSYRWLASRKPYLIFGDAGSVYAYRQLAPKFLAAALGSGHAEAFAEMAQALEEGIVFDRDPQAAYAYALAAELAGGQELEVGRRLAKALVETLSPSERRDAKRKARELCDTYCL